MEKVRYCDAPWSFLAVIQIFVFMKSADLFMYCNYTFWFIHVGVRFTSYHGNFMLRSTDLLALPAVDCDKAFAMQLSLEEALLTTQTVYFQVALLYPFRWLCDVCYINKSNRISQLLDLLGQNIKGSFGS